MPETLIQQSINKRVDGRVEHKQSVRKNVWDWAKQEDVKVAKDVNQQSCDPTSSKYGTDSDYT